MFGLKARWYLDIKDNLQLSVYICVIIVAAIFKIPETPEARKAAFVEDRPACKKRTGAYFFEGKTMLSAYLTVVTYIKDTIYSTSLPK
jgi:hypothetical protein